MTGGLVPQSGGSSDEMDFEFIQRTAQELAAEGRQLKPGQSAAAGQKAVVRFTKELTKVGFSMDAVRQFAKLDEHDRPVFPAEVFCAYAVWIATNSDMSESGLATHLAHLNAGLRAEGWSILHLHGDADQGSKIRRIAKPLAAKKRPRKPARPARINDVSDFFDALEATDTTTGPGTWAPLAKQYMRLSLSLWPTAVRPSNARSTIKRGWIDIEAECIRVPGKGFKTTVAQGATHKLHHHNDCSAGDCVPRCFFFELAATDKLCEEHGIPTGDNDALFIAIKNGRAGKGVLFDGGDEWVANPVDYATARYVDAGMSPGVAKGYAVAALMANYRTRWKELIEAAGFEPRHALEQTGEYAMRRGPASEASDAGDSEEQIAIRLGHAPGSRHTAAYLEPTQPDTASLWQGQFDKLPERKIVELPGITTDTQVFEWRSTCEVEHNGDACGNKTKTMHWLEIDGTQFRMCSGHRNRWWKGKRGDDFTKPLGKQAAPVPADATCEVEHNGTACGRNKDVSQLYRIDVDGRSMTACDTHKTRWDQGKRGDDLTKPFRKPIPADATCEIEHNGDACGNKTKIMNWLEIDGRSMTACDSHKIRWRKGKRGDALTKPIAKR